jgi:hypothetical protein
MRQIPFFSLSLDIRHCLGVGGIQDLSTFQYECVSGPENFIMEIHFYLIGFDHISNALYIDRYIQNNFISRFLASV